MSAPAQQEQKNPGKAIAVPPAAGKDVATKESTPIQRFRWTLDKLKPQLGAALPKHISPDRLIRIIVTTVQRTPELLECTPVSMMGALLQCAQLGLEPDGILGQAYLIPFRNWKTNCKEVQLIPGYRGLMKLAHQSGEVSHITARVVREKDAFRYWYGLEEGIEHQPHRGPEAGEIVAVYAWAEIKGAGRQFVVLERWEIDAIRARSKSSGSGPWVTDYPEMAKKSAIRRLCKMIPASVEKDNLAHAVALDERAEAGIGQEIDYSHMIDASVAEPVALPEAFAHDPGPSQDEVAPDDAEKKPVPAKPTNLKEAAAAGRAQREKRMTIEVPAADGTGSVVVDPLDNVISGAPPSPELPREP